MRFLSHCLILVLLLLTPVTITPQNPEGFFEDSEKQYTLRLPAKWTAIVNKDGLGRDDVIFVWGSTREDGAMTVRRMDIDAAMKSADAAKKDEDQTLRFRPGYARGAVENFAATYDTTVVSYDYTQAGRPKMGRKYYLRVNDTTVYTLWFTGNRQTLGILRSQTDSIARSFKVTG
ncbi:MAG: hypothetical protein ACKV2V_11185 [Blastocatellia bacterium]